MTLQDGDLLEVFEPVGGDSSQSTLALDCLT